jgi:hypothetical protein
VCAIAANPGASFVGRADFSEHGNRNQRSEVCLPFCRRVEEHDAAE